MSFPTPERLQEILASAQACMFQDIRHGLLTPAELLWLLKWVQECPCATGAPGDYEGALRDCPRHGDDRMKSHAQRQAEDKPGCRGEDCPVCAGENGACAGPVPQGDGDEGVGPV
jgi:hypothetical protein